MKTPRKPDGNHASKKPSAGIKSLRKVRILVADDFAEWRAAASKIVHVCPTWSVVAEACNGVEAVQKATELRPDVVLLDISMPVLNGLEAAKMIKQASPASKIVFLTQDNDAELKDTALATGAEGYVSKARAASDLQVAVKAALRNGSRPYALNSRSVPAQSSPHRSFSRLSQSSSRRNSPRK